MTTPKSGVEKASEVLAIVFMFLLACIVIALALKTMFWIINL